MNRLYIEGVGFWAPGLPDWASARLALRGEPLPEPATPPAKRPSPQMLAPAERRRAPDTVALALEAAAAAVTAAGRDARELPGIFVSAHGDLGINDYMCATLAANPTLLSPTKFHNSVHNAAVGYWTMATGCHQASTALTAYELSFANGLLAAAVQCAADDRPVLLVAYDISAVGALASVSRSQGLLAIALVVSPSRGAHSLASVDWQLGDHAAAPVPLQSAAAQALAGNASADGLPLLEALARGEATTLQLQLPLSARQTLQLTLSP